MTLWRSEEEVRRRRRAAPGVLLSAMCVAALLFACGGVVVRGTSMGKNDHGFPRSGPIEPLAYPDSALESFERGFALLHALTHARGLPVVACEVVIVDDKSTDESVKVRACSECPYAPPNYTLVEHQENRGAGVSRNDGVAAGKGGVIFFGEADDVFYEHHIPMCWDQLRQHPNVGFAKMRMDAVRQN
ncbi:hypothetical protein T484DRAFT_1785749 [Baffinella frigidus]|nr:hypothetical protein T484DRAFT_1785749 [Cryptophyta sp. CCMP2293]